MAEPYIVRRALAPPGERPRGHLRGGDGQPVFLHGHDRRPARQRDQSAEVILKATKVDGIYTADPVKDPTATRYEHITYTEALAKRLAVMDATAFSLCQDNKVPIIVFDMNQPGNILRAVLGEKIGTLVTDV